MKPLSKTQIKYLKQLAHSKSISVIVGQHGLSDAIYNETDIQLAAHELIKIKLPAVEKVKKTQMLQSICDACHSQLVTQIGRIGIVYRPAQQPNIQLPAK